MYFNLALQNVKKSYKDFLIYFLTLAFSVCLFYTFNSFQAQEAVLDLNASQHDVLVSIQQLIKILSFIVAMILAFLIIYANQFLIKRRKKELGIYTLLGMPKHNISRILIYETFMIGLISLATGIIFGILASQLLSVITANMFEVTLNYRFIFSIDAMIFTIIVFSLIFIVIMFFNSLSLNHYKLIDLLTANRKNETLKIKNIWLSVLLFIISIGLIGYTYHYALSKGIDALFHIPMIAACGISGTVLFFMSLSGFLLKFTQCSKQIYFRKLNMFVLRQINSSINSNFISMSVVCLMLLFSIGALATGSNLNKTINNTIKTSTVYDYSYTNSNQERPIEQIKEDLHVDMSMIKEDFFVHEYEADQSFETLTPFIKDNSIIQSANQMDEPYTVLPLSTYNQLRKDRGLNEVDLKINEAHIFTSSDMMTTIIGDIIDAHPTLHLYGHDVTITNDDFDYIQGGTTIQTATFIVTVVICDDLIPNDLIPLNSYWNVKLNDPDQQDQFLEKMNEAVNAYQDTLAQDENSAYHTFSSETANTVKENSKGTAVLLTYIGIYLGIVFLIASAVILALQQLSQASDNVARYQILNKIGAEKRMLSHAILLQMAIYFFMPLLLGVIHSIVGIQVVNIIIQVFGESDIFGASMIAGSIILAVYGSYFLVTYWGSKRILLK
ncbi:MAG: ABC transporter permease [Erysipelotrichaceae bacterium]|nr:ABC transporter permease [Erysipelotrichaceae bacterium]